MSSKSCAYCDRKAGKLLYTRHDRNNTLSTTCRFTIFRMTRLIVIRIIQPPVESRLQQSIGTIAPFVTPEMLSRIWKSFVAFVRGAAGNERLDRSRRAGMQARRNHPTSALAR